ncbi:MULTISPECIES: hypothetical protein [Microtetraspora]|uniref:Uncharacterized protein n=1 Tax=Microtetraspora glauca TaxID=1996 RepID=A0ABV3GGC0_MICGL|nr:hypothetical protein [Microtetraspora sp. AC03309]MCC5581110.1 hypothetical protein [Microtetraspora sp. AC03309]
MARQIHESLQQPSMAELEARIRGLESRLAHLTKIVDALTEATPVKLTE